MTGIELKAKRITAGISGMLVCVRTGLDRGKLSRIERGYSRPSPEEAEKISRAIDELAAAKEAVVTAAEAHGWPVSAL